jgi:hypothetical protein
MRTRVVTALCALAVTAGCGGGDQGGSAGDPPAAKGKSASYSTVEKVREALAGAGLGCGGWVQNVDVIAAREDGTCLIGAEEVTITIYNSEEQKQTVREAFSALETGISVEGDVWVVGVDTPELAEKVRSAIGGSVT